MDAMKEFQDFIHRGNALRHLGNENWDLEAALERLLRFLGINYDTKFGGQSNVSAINMTGMQNLEHFDIDCC